VQLARNGSINLIHLSRQLLWRDEVAEEPFGFVTA
jgi:hypothetical protein